jgi:hypothetical protein
MTETPTLIETSFADAIAIIAPSQELPEQTRRHWTTSLRQIAKALDRPLEVIPARYSAIRTDLAQLHEAPAGLTTKTLQNHKSNTKSALLWLGREKGIPQHGAPLTAPWEALRAAIDMYLNQSRPILLKSSVPTNSLWISSRTGQQVTTKNLGTLISKITYQTVGVDVSPHLFRTAAATTAAMYAGNTPHLASAVLGHTDPRVTEEDYTRVTSINAAKTYTAIIRQYRSR